MLRNEASDGKSTDINLLVVGDYLDHAKTHLLYHLIGKDFSADLPVIFEDYTMKVKLNEREYDLHLRDTTGSEKFPHVRSVFYKKINMIVLTYSIYNRESFDNIANRWQEEAFYFCPFASYILIALGEASSKKPAVVTSEEGRQLANKTQSIFVESDMKTSSVAIKVAMEKALRIRSLMEDKQSILNLLSAINLETKNSYEKDTGKIAHLLFSTIDENQDNRLPFLQLALAALTLKNNFKWKNKSLWSSLFGGDNKDEVNLPASLEELLSVLKNKINDHIDPAVVQIFTESLSEKGKKDFNELLYLSPTSVEQTPSFAK